MKKSAIANGTEKPATPPTPPLWLSYVKLTRIHKFPLGSMLMFWPCAWGVTMAAIAVGLPWKSLALNTALYLVGATLRHSAGCVWNDICDIDFDRKVVSVAGAFSLFLVLTLLCIGLLAFVNSEALRAGLFGLFFLDLLYPFMKRWTHWPQAWLGLAMNWGAPVSWIAITGSVDWRVAPALLLGGVFWTLHYDTIYACQDKHDDVKAGVKSTAVLFGDAVRSILACFSALFMACLAYAGWVAQQGPAFFAVAIAGGTLHLIWQLRTLDFDSVNDCLRMFKVRFLYSRRNVSD
ncbi:UbiA prenyltransferase family [Sparassis latifolia]